ncbi:MAG TPA: hypothetical protein VGB68_15165, partial [Pyrinomonadaceae bacterium]
MDKLVIEYKHGIAESVDRAIIRAVGKDPKNTGCMAVEPFARDLVFEFRTEEAALSAKARVEM